MSQVPQKKAKKSAPIKKTRRNGMEKVARREINTVRTMVRANAIKGNASRVEAKVAESICLPGEEGTSSYRWSSPFNAAKTALAHPFQMSPLNFGAVNPTNSELSRYEHLSVLTRNPLCSLIIYDQNAAGATSTYQLFARSGGDGVPSGTVAYLLDSQDSVDIPFTEGDCISGPTTYQAHGPTMYPGFVSSNPKGRFFWYDKGTTLTFTIECALAINVALQCDYWGPNGFSSNFVNDQITLVSDEPQTVTLINLGDEPGYYSLRLKNDSNSDEGTIVLSNITYQVTSSCFRHLACPSLAPVIGSIKGIRVLGHSIKLTNTSSQLNRGGQIIARQTPGGTNWQTYISNDVYTHLSQQSDAIALEAKDGMYGFLKISDSDDLDLCQYHVINSESTLVDSKWPIDNPKALVVMVVKVPSQDSASFQMTERMVLEYQTDNLFFDTDVASLPVNLYTSAIALTRDVPQFYENPLHFGEIWNKIQNFVSKAVDGVAKYAPLIGKVASML